MLKKYLDFIKRFASTLSIIVAIAVSSYQFTVETKESIETGISSAIKDHIYDSRVPFYLFEEYSLRKQLEKMEKDPNDLKTTDVELLYIMCRAEFGTKYIPSLPANRQANAQRACDQISALYIKRNVY